MRSSGSLAAPPADVGAHVCWCFEDDAAFREAAVAYLAGGVGRTERVVYVADRPAEAMRADVAPLGDVDRLVGDSALVLQPVRDLYEPGGVFDGERQLQAYRDLVAGALRDGYSGLRVAADATALVADDVARRRFVRYELAIDRFMATEPMSALCAYDGRVLGPALAELVAVHPLHHGVDGEGAAFRAYYDGHRLRLVGELDLANRDVFGVVAEAIESSDAAQVTVDLGGLGFIDVRGLVLLSQLATRLRAGGRALRLLDAPPLVRECCELLGFDGVVEGGAVAS